MKAGNVPSTLLTQEHLDARHYLGATDTAVDPQREVVAKNEQRLAASKAKLARLEASRERGAIHGVKVIR